MRRRLPEQTLPRATRPLWLRLSPLLALLLLAIGQTTTPSYIQFSFLLAALPPLTAFINGPIVTSGVAAVVMAAMTALLVVGDGLPNTIAIDLNDLVTAAVICALSVVAAWARERNDAHLVRIRTVAEAVQRAVLPELPPRVGGLSCAAMYRSAQRDARVGGDLYDVQITPYGVRAIIADVKGHGLEAVATVTALLGTFREAVLDVADLTGVGDRLERRMVWANRGRGQWETVFATALLLEIPQGGGLRLVSHGHPCPLLLRDGRVRELTVEPNPPLGLGPMLSAEGLPGFVGIRPGDVLVTCTDGVLEARNTVGAFYPLAGRLEWYLATGGDLAPERVVDYVRDDLDQYAGSLEDDVALLVIGFGAATP